MIDGNLLVAVRLGSSKRILFAKPGKHIFVDGCCCRVRGLLLGLRVGGISFTLLDVWNRWLLGN